MSKHVKYVFLGLLMITGYVLLSAQADARTCVIYKGGTCVFWSGSVKCDVTANQLGNVTKEPKSAKCDVTSQAGPAGCIEGLVVCGNPGANQHKAPGINLTAFCGTLEGLSQITSVDKNGAALTTVIASASDADLQTLNAACPNTGWTAFDFVPCSMQAIADVIDENTGASLGTATFNCTLPNCSTLQWDKKTGTIEQRQYDCVQIQ